MTLTTLLIVSATVLSAISVVQSNGKSPLAWACFLLALAFCLPLVG
jgi:hypothetical protein